METACIRRAVNGVGSVTLCCIPAQLSPMRYV
jgi:hypothetical protein